MNTQAISLAEAKKMSPVGDIPKEAADEMTSFLNQILANEYFVFTKTLNYHWNVTGPRFHSLHVFLEKHYNELLVVMDDVAERIRVIGKHPISTVHEMDRESHLKEKPGTWPEAMEMLNDLLRDHLTIQKEIREYLGKSKALEKDPGTEDFLVSTLRKHEMMSWMLKSHLD